MNTLGPGSLTAFIKVLLDIIAFILWIFLGAASLVMVFVMAAGIYRVFGFSLNLPRVILDFLQLSFVMALPMAITAIVVFTLIVDRLRRICRTLVKGDPFVPENAGHLRFIAITIAIYQMIRYAVQGAVSLTFTLFGRPVESAGNWEPHFTLNLGAWFAVLALLVLSEVFREGARLRDEQQFTI